MSRLTAAWLALSVTVLAGCSTAVPGTATWPGAILDQVVLTQADFPAGVRYERLAEQSGQPDNAGGASPMLSRPEGCSNGLTDVIAESAERGPGSAVKYNVEYDGAELNITVLSWTLDLAKLEQTAQRCERFEALFDASSEGIPITTTQLAYPDGSALVYQQTMELSGAQSSVYIAFQNVGRLAVFGIANDVPNSEVPVKASLPQTFTDVIALQAERLRTA
ncbi:MAG: hypothetical protein ACSLE6_07080 [Mycobacterium sp.]